MGSKKMKGGMVDSDTGYVSQDEIMQKIKRSKSPLNFLNRRRSAPDDSVPQDGMTKSDLKAWNKDRLKNEKYGETASYGDVDAIEKAKKEVAKLKQAGRLKQLEDQKNYTPMSMDEMDALYNFPQGPHGDSTAPLQPSELENNLMNKREENCKRVLNETCRFNCSRITGSGSKCSRCVDDIDVQEKCKGDPLKHRDNFPSDLMARLGAATPERKNSVRMRTMQEGEKQIKDKIKIAEKGLINSFTRKRTPKKTLPSIEGFKPWDPSGADRPVGAIKGSERHMRPPAYNPNAGKGLHEDIFGPATGNLTAIGGARRRRRTNRRKPKKSKKSKRTRRTRRR